MKLRLAAALALVALSTACERSGRPYACTCSVITDFDDASKHDVEICSPTPERAPGFAKGCAQAGAPAKVESCTCAPIDGPTCSLDLCATRPR